MLLRNSYYATFSLFQNIESFHNYVFIIFGKRKHSNDEKEEENDGKPRKLAHVLNGGGYDDEIDLITEFEECPSLHSPNKVQKKLD